MPVAARLFITVSFMALIVALSVVPGRPQPGDSAFVWIVAATPPTLQKTMHVVVYAAMTLLLGWTLQTVRSRTLRLVTAAGIALCFGALMEWFQTMVPGRFGALIDVALNAVGVIAAILVTLLL